MKHLNIKHAALTKNTFKIGCPQVDKMNSNTINIFEFPSNLGLIKTEFEIEPGVKLLPDWLKKNQFHDRIKPEHIFTLQPPDYSMDLDEESGVRNTEKIISYAKRQAGLLSEHLKQNSFQIIIGGDCSILIGNALALKQKGEYGLFFLDGHTDYVLPELSVSKQAAAMELAIVTGYGHDKLTNILTLKPYFKESNVWCVGNREYASNIVKPILDSDINYFDLNTLRKTGIENCTLQFLKMIEENELDGFLIHLDADVLNDDIMPAVDSREKDGLNYSEFTTLLGMLLSSPKAIGIEITILDPCLDRDGKYTTEFVSNFLKVIEIGKNPAHNNAKLY
jgi:arginase